MKQYDPVKVAAATALRSQGLSYHAIGRQLGASTTCVNRWLNPEKAARDRKKKRDRQRERYATEPGYADRQREYGKSKRKILVGRCKQYLQQSRSSARRGNYRPCEATAQEVMDAICQQNFCCKICGKADSRGARLCMDHCHMTGAFRAWLCRKCNTAIALLEEDVARLHAAARYLSVEYKIAEVPSADV